jgi:uracil-DNA glycosylase family 4
MTNAEKLQELNTKWLAECTCKLRKTATQGVPGFGNADARIVFIGEAPGAKEDKGGRPFIGAAGKFLDEMLASIKMKREDIYITNIVKYRPPENRDPTPKEIADCVGWLEEEIKIIDPVLIVFLGRYSMNYFFPKMKISEEHGELTTEKYFGRLRNFLPLYHPAAALYNGSLREVLKEDFSRIPKLLKMLERERSCDTPI